MALRQETGGGRSVSRGYEVARRDLATQGEMLEMSGVPVDSEKRIKASEYSGKPGYAAEEVARDNAYVLSKQQEFHQEYCNKHGKLSFERYLIESKRNEAEQLEVLKTALFSKFFGDRAMVCRTALYDDIENGVDNIIVDLESGQPICAVDELSEDKADFSDLPMESGPKEILRVGAWFRKMIDRSNVLREKASKIEHVNVCGGASIKYGVSYRNENKIPALRQMSNIPKFLITLPPSIIRKAMDTYSSQGTKTPQERAVVDIILKELVAEAEIYMGNRDMPENMKIQLKTAHAFLTKERELAKE
ncbi:MAG: hypothetical protein A3I39_01655 [Candidatus Yanofskybacteria bacterium RIFCSPLOWO2_02_FULL_47_9b]|uniref:Uncharacterized protein n=1 Tax=Candidatus Yanofskybacteria bacterium RIFCSPLOWO2_02_FULL_47_9b TaxID=1802708 RepID=A0A1F8H912_9BACT|nr:MAG: hypothetical protein A3I39_01655 [Candidatus Yanofskybacteria bacterium RIFCSPLOWO2_02_FULL_47_9b]